MGRLTLLAPIAWRNLWRNPRRTVITLMVVAIGVWSILMFDVLIKAVADSSREAALRLLTGHGQIHATGYLDDPGLSHSMAAPNGALLSALNSAPIIGWAPRLRVPAVVQSEYRTRSITLMGVSPAAERRVSDMPAAVRQGRYLSSDADAGVYIGQDLAEKLKTRIGKRVIIMAQAGDGRLAEASFTIIGVYGGATSTEDEFVFTGLASAQQLLGAEGQLSEISLYGDPKAKLSDIMGPVKRAAPKGLDVQSWLELSPLAATIETFSQSFTVVWLLVMFVLMAIGIVNTQLMAVFERTKEFGLLQALGMRPGLIVLQVTLESAFLIGLGVLAGALAMLICLSLMSQGVDLGAFAQGMSMAGLGDVLKPQLHPADAAAFCFVVWALGVLAALWPARMAARAAPVAAMAETN
jgi:ABC-type lipoprotein release transport system permease subunit